MDPSIIASIISLGAMGILFGGGLAIASKKLAVKVDPKVQQILEILPNANCSACGLPGCSAYAEKLVEGGAEINACIPGGNDVASAIGEILGVEADQREAQVARLQCQGSRDVAQDKYIYQGIQDCKAAILLGGGNKACNYGCLGLGTCVRACPFDALHIGPKGLPVVDTKRCTGCGKCREECPLNLFILVDRSQKVYVGCHSNDKGPAVKRVCSMGCIGCKICEKSCPYDAVKVNDFLAEIDYEKCRNCGICAAKCPTNAIVDTVKVRPLASISTSCDGCGKCRDVCPMKAIEGEEKERHRIIKEKCVGCGLCYEICPVKAIHMSGALGHQEKVV
jgi:electron transport complex protein RnfB